MILKKKMFITMAEQPEEAAPVPQVSITFVDISAETQRRITACIEREIRRPGAAIEAASASALAVSTVKSVARATFWPTFCTSSTHLTAAAALDQFNVQFNPERMSAIGEERGTKRQRLSSSGGGGGAADANDEMHRRTSWWRARYHDGSGEVGPSGPFAGGGLERGTISAALGEALGGVQGVALLQRRMKRWGCAAGWLSANNPVSAASGVVLKGGATLVVFDEEGEDASRTASAPTGPAAASAPAAPAAAADFPLPACTCSACPPAFST